MIAFDKDVDVADKKNQSKFYGLIPDDHNARGTCFALMTMISAVHNLSRSIGTALLAASGDGMLVAYFVGGEMVLFLLFKILRGDYFYWLQFDPLMSFVGSFFERTLLKVITDFSGCLHLRHPYEAGGLVFTLSIFWTHIFHFVALQFYHGNGIDDNNNDMSKTEITTFLTGSAMLWTVLNIIFLCMIDVSFLTTFFWTKTAPQYTSELFLNSEEDSSKFQADFNNRLQYTESVHGEVKEWVGANIARWKEKREDWFNIEMIPDDFLPRDVLDVEGGAKKRISSVSLREIVGVAPAVEGEQQLALPPRQHCESDVIKQTKEAWKKVAEAVYETRSNNYKSNIIHVRRIFGENEELMKPLLVRSERAVRTPAGATTRLIELHACNE